MERKEWIPEWALAPIWEGETAEHETVLFLSDRESARLLYPADAILSVVSADQKTEYVSGKDYDLVDGCLRRLPGSAIPAFPVEEYYPAEHKDGADFGCTVVGHPYLRYGEADTFARWQIDVTYRHHGAWMGTIPAGCRQSFAEFHQKMASGAPTTIVFYGDSITTGATSSITYGKEPFMASFPHMVAEAIAKAYGYTVEYLREPYEDTVREASGKDHTLRFYNTAVGGMDARWGDEHVEEFVNVFAPDLVVYGFGMNDGGKTADEFIALTKSAVGKIRNAYPACGICLISTMLPHFRAAGFFGHQIEYEPYMFDYAAEDDRMAVAPMTSVHQALLRRKEFYDMTGNNVNHCNDYLARVYAMTILRTIME